MCPEACLALAVVDQFNVDGVRSFKTENDTPVRPHRWAGQALNNIVNGKSGISPEMAIC
jgi:hypothetical protein